MDQARPAPAQLSPSMRRPRGRRMAFATLLIAGAFLLGTDLALDGGDRLGIEWDGVRTVNSARAIMTALIPPPPAVEEESPTPGLGGLFMFGAGSNAAPVETASQREARLRMHRQIAAVEGVAWGWERAMWGLAGLLAGVAVLSWLTPWGRGWHLLAAMAIFLMTGLTLACIRYLEIPDGGGQSLWPLSLEKHQELARRFNVPEGGGMPPVPLRTYVGLAVLMSAYGWLLLGVYIWPTKRLRRPEDLSDISRQDG